uniref:CBS domain-containing protein n=1 Tax=Ignisphaera aggregans TaxID=334771 RepID=A0A7J3Z761_9CREN
MSKAVVSVPPNTSIRRVVELMHSKNIGSVLVVDERGNLVGIFTERDLVRVVALGIDLETPVERVMTVRPITASLNEGVVEVAYKMVENWVRHLPVVDESGRVVGVVSIRDVLRAYLAGSAFP